jgi:L,D-transpeptidase YcbB
MRTVLSACLLFLAAILAGHTECVARTGAAAPEPALAQPTQPTQLPQPTQPIERLLAAGPPPGSVTDGKALYDFYARRGFLPAWSGPEGLGPAARELLAALEETRLEGLEPEDYGTAALVRPLAAAGSPQSPEALAELDIQLTAAFDAAARDLATGKAKRPGHDIRTPRPASAHSIDRLELLGEALASGRVREKLRSLAPADPAYRRLTLALARYRDLEARGGWLPLPAGVALPGERSPVAAALRARLAAEGDLPAPLSTPTGDLDLFDPELAAALTRFQERAGLPAKGLLDAPTRTALDVPAAERVRQILANLERRRWLPRDLGERHVLVNLPDYRLELVSGGQTELAMRAIIGTPARSTPSLSLEAVAVVVNPHWNVPKRIAETEILPKARADRRYLARNGYERVAGKPTRIRQKPGPGNSLGVLKVHLDNSPEIYLHDTPGRHRFALARRALSHGCIRLEKPLDLALALLGGEPDETRQRVDEILAGGKEKWLRLPERVPVHLVYFTAWADEEGTVHFRPDIYKRDPALFALFEKPAGPAEPAPERLAERGR